MKRTLFFAGLLVLASACAADDEAERTVEITAADSGGKIETPAASSKDAGADRKRDAAASDAGADADAGELITPILEAGVCRTSGPCTTDAECCEYCHGDHCH